MRIRLDARRDGRIGRPFERARADKTEKIDAAVRAQDERGEAARWPGILRAIEDAAVGAERTPLSVDVAHDHVAQHDIGLGFEYRYGAG